MKAALNFEQWKVKYLEWFKTNSYTVAWDSGHAYHTHEAISPDECDDSDMAYAFESEHMADNACTLYCVPSVINKLSGEFSVVCDECYDQCNTDEEKVDYLEGFIALMGKHSWGSRESVGYMEKFYHIAELKDYVDQLKAGIQLSEELADYSRLCYRSDAGC